MDAPTIIFTILVPIVLTALVNYLFNRRDKNLGYSDNRSEYITRARFDKEIECIQELSTELLIFIQITKQVVLSRSKTTRSSNTNYDYSWASQRKKVIQAIGASGPFLNYLSLADKSKPFCGVDTKHCNVKAFDIENKALANKRDLITKHCICEASEKEKSNDRTLSLQTDSIDSMYIDIQSISSGNKNLYQRACEILMLCDYVYRTGDFSCLRNDADTPCKGNEGSAHEYRTYLDCRYERFIDCAYCRLNAIEYGRKNIRQNNKRAAKRSKGIRKWREDNLRRYDQSCPYTDLIEK